MPDTETKPAPSYLSAFEPKLSGDDHAKVCGTMLLYLGMPLVPADDLPPAVADEDVEGPQFA